MWASSRAAAPSSARTPILTAAHLVWDADVGASADAVSIYPGFTPDTTTYNPPGALPGLQSIHTIKVADGDDQISASATQSDFAVIDTSADLSGFGQFALDPSFASDDVVVNGYPASSDGGQAGTGGLVSKNAVYSDIDNGSLNLSPGYSGGPLWDRVERNGSLVPAVVGTVSTNLDAMKLTTPKVDLIRHWIASDRSLYAGGTYAPRGLVPQLDGTVSGQVDAAPVTRPLAAKAFTYADPSATSGTAGGVAPAVDPAYADLVASIHGTAAAGTVDGGAVASQQAMASIAASAFDVSQRQNPGA